MRLSTVGQLAKELGIEPRTIQLWVQRGIITPTFHQPGKGGRSLFAAIDVLVVATVRDLRLLGLGLDDCGAAARLLRILGPGRLQKAWSKGKTHLAVLPGRTLAQLIDPRQPPTAAVSNGGAWVFIDLAACNAALSAGAAVPGSFEALRT
jgi:DNA-binding transcriptional MerR regulator